MKIVAIAVCPLTGGTGERQGIFWKSRIDCVVGAQYRVAAMLLIEAFSTAGDAGVGHARTWLVAGSNAGWFINGSSFSATAR